MYPVHQTSHNRYEFLTDDGIIYVVEFDNASYYFPASCAYSNRIESINFYPVKPPSKKIRDRLIAPTIANIIKDRCRTQNGAIVYVCDSLDDKAACRSKLFDNWNETFNEGAYHFQQVVINYQNILEAHAGLIVEVSNVDAHGFLNDFVMASRYIASK